MAEVKSDNQGRGSHRRKRDHASGKPETKNQRVSRSNTTEVRIRAAPEKVLVPSSAGMGQDWLQHGR